MRGSNAKRKIGPTRWAAAAIVVVLAGACNPITDNLGNRTLKENVDQIQVGRTTKLDVVRLLGSPSNIAAFDPNTWYYVSAKQVEYAFLKPRTIEQNVLVLRFDESGVVRDMKKLGLDDAQPTTYVARTTPTRGGEPGLLRSLYDTLMRGPLGRNRGKGTKGPDL
ncbi:MAG: outer membrane protein assembly factor BamE [Rhodospirillaceae bacterium]|nr:outer membrane protein assembly factor BamE [Rhodospirillaceae bacterium]